MSKRVKVPVKKSEVKSQNVLFRKPKAHSPKSPGSPVDRILHLQGTVGNQVVQRMIQSGVLQAKLRIGRPNDQYEQEADRVADQVMRMPDIQRSPVCSSCGEQEEQEPSQTKPLAGQITPLVQRQVEPEEEEEEPIQTKLADGAQIQRQEEEPEEEEEEPIQTKLVDGVQIQRQVEPEEEEELIQTKKAGNVTPEVTPAISSSIQSLQGGGRPLSRSERSFFEPRFRADFSGVRVHNDTQAASVARSVNARAFTFGHNVVFGSGEYSPGASSGIKLLAHELTHVVQQAGTASNTLLQREEFGNGIRFNSLPGCPPRAEVLGSGISDIAIAQELYSDPEQDILYMNDNVIAIWPYIRDEWWHLFDFDLCNELLSGPSTPEPSVPTLIGKLVSYGILNPTGSLREFNNILYRHISARPRTSIGNDYLAFLRHAYPMRGFAITYRGQHWNALYNDILDFYGVPRLPRYLAMRSALGVVRREDVRNLHMYDECAYETRPGYVIRVGGATRLSASTLRRVRQGSVIRGYPIEGTLLLTETDRFLGTLSLTAAGVSGTTVPAATTGAIIQWSVGPEVRSQEIGGVSLSICPLTSCELPTQRHVFGDPNRFDNLIVYWTNHFNEIFLPLDRSRSPNRLDPNLVKTIIYKETQFHPRAEEMRRRPGGGGRGLTQITPPTGQVVAEERPGLGQFAVGVRGIMHRGRFSSGDPAVQIAAGIRVLFQKYQRAGDWRGAVALYPDPTGSAGYTRAVSRVYECRTGRTL